MLLHTQFCKSWHNLLPYSSFFFFFLWIYLNRSYFLVWMYFSPASMQSNSTLFISLQTRCIWLLASRKVCQPPTTRTLRASTTLGWKGLPVKWQVQQKMSEMTDLILKMSKNWIFDCLRTNFKPGRSDRHYFKTKTNKYPLNLSNQPIRLLSFPNRSGG